MPARDMLSTRMAASPTLRKHARRIAKLLQVLQRMDETLRPFVLEVVGEASARDATGRTFVATVLQDTGDSMSVLQDVTIGLIKAAAIRRNENDPWTEANTLEFRAGLQMNASPKMGAVKSVVVMMSCSASESTHSVERANTLRKFEDHVRAARTNCTARVLDAGLIEGACAYARFANTLLISMDNQITTIFCIDVAQRTGDPRPPPFDFEPLLDTMREAADGRPLRVRQVGHYQTHCHSIVDAAAREKLAASVRMLADFQWAQDGVYTLQVPLERLVMLDSEIAECWDIVERSIGL